MIVVDASVAFKWIQKGEEYREEASILYRNHTVKKEKILVPSLLYLEIANAFATKSETTQKTTREALKFIFNSKLNLYEPEENDIVTASRLAKKHKTSVYDMLYAVVAKKHKTTLITADERFVKKTRFRHVAHLRNIVLKDNGN